MMARWTSMLTYSASRGLLISSLPEGHFTLYCMQQ
jgi:hypothetical protein